MSDYFRRCWSRSRTFRVILVIVLVYTVLRLAVQGVYLIVMSCPGQVIMGFELPKWVGAAGPMIPVDLKVYLDAARHFQLGQDLYLKGSLEHIEYHYPYPPSYAMAFVPCLWLSPIAVSIVHTLFHIITYGLLYIQWGRIFHRTGLHLAGEMLVWTLPVWLVFAEFWSDLGYLNIYIIMALLASLLIDAVLNERLGWSLLWLSIILQTKPMWACAIAIPLLLGRYRFFFKLLALAVIVYAAIAGITIVAAGPAYGWRQYVDYVHLLSRLGHDFPWRGPDAPFLGYNHSVKQIIIYLLGLSPETMRLAIGIKALLLIPLAVVSLRRLLRPVRRAGREVPRLSLELAFALYLGVYIWLDVVWELSLGIVVFTYLLAILCQRGAKFLAGVAFLPYALIDFWRIFTLAIFGLDVFLPGAYIQTDPSIYIPLVMIVILTFYALVVRQLWTVSVLGKEKIGTG